MGERGYFPHPNADGVWKAFDWKRLGKVLLACLFIQLLFWPFHLWLNESSDVPMEGTITNFEWARLDAPDYVSLQSAGEWQAEQSFAVVRLETPAYLGLRTSFDVETVENELGLGVAFIIDNYHTYVNGVRLAGRGRLDYPATYHGNKREIIRVPAGLLREGKNEVEIIGTQNSYGRFAIQSVIFGDYAEIIEATRKRKFVLGDYNWLAIIVCTLISTVCLFIVPLTRSKVYFGALGFLAGAIALRAWLINFNYSGFGDIDLEDAVHTLTLSLIPLSWLVFTDRWSGKPTKWVLPLAVSLYGIVILSCSLYFLPFAGDISEYIDDAMDYMTFFVIAGTVALLLKHVIVAEEHRYFEVAILILALSLTLVDSYGFAFTSFDYNLMRTSSFIVLAALLVAVLSRNVRIYESRDALNAQLRETVQQREREIASRYRELQTVRRERDIASERQRILRDMHDGIGSQLVMLLTSLRNRKVDPEVIENELEETLTDLRLMIDSLDRSAADLAVAMGTFRRRVAPTLEAAGISLIWDVADLPFGVELSPRTTLQVFRILQEAVTNAVKHASASQIVISARKRDGDLECYDFAVTDNGTGFDTSAERATASQGLKSMRQRAETIGAEFSVTSGETGTRIGIDGICRPSKAEDDQGSMKPDFMAS